MEALQKVISDTSENFLYLCAQPGGGKVPGPNFPGALLGDACLRF